MKSFSCLRCRNTFSRTNGEVNRGRTKFCTRLCSDLYKKEKAATTAKLILIKNKKQCKSCNLTKKLDLFPKSKASLTGYFSYCFECRKDINRIADKKRWSEQREKLVLQRRKAHLKKEFGISLETYNNLFKSQNFSCAICKKTNENNLKNFAIDHCHEKNTVRGILCENCNRGIGMFKDNIEILKSAISYLENSSDLVLTKQ